MIKDFYYRIFTIYKHWVYSAHSRNSMYEGYKKKQVHAFTLFQDGTDYTLDLEKYAPFPIPNIYIWYF